MERAILGFVQAPVIEVEKPQYKAPTLKALAPKKETLSYHKPFGVNPDGTVIMDWNPDWDSDKRNNRGE